MPFFSSLIYTGTRVGGLRERQTQSFEAGVPHFPRDYPCTAAYAAYAATRMTEEKTRWERKPPAKRPNFEKLGTRSPWGPDWEVVLGLPSAHEEAGEDCVTTQREAPPAEGGTNTEKVQPWLLRGPETASILASSFELFNPGAGLWSEMNKLRMKRGHDPLDGGPKVGELWQSALVTVKVLMCRRGAPDDLAVLYRVEDEEAKKWIKMPPDSVCVTENDDSDETEVGVGRLARQHDIDISFSTDLRDPPTPRLHNWVHHHWKLFALSR
jgi:ribonuclease P/MRP protein subunit POP1